MATLFFGHSTSQSMLYTATAVIFYSVKDANTAIFINNVLIFFTVVLMFSASVKNRYPTLWLTVILEYSRNFISKYASSNKLLTWFKGKLSNFNWLCRILFNLTSVAEVNFAFNSLRISYLKKKNIKRNCMC